MRNLSFSPYQILQETKDNNIHSSQLNWKELRTKNGVALVEGL